MKFSKNLAAQLLSVVLLAFTFSGLAIPDTQEPASKIVDYLYNGQFFALLTYLLVNLANIFWHWYKQLKTDSSKFFDFVHSINFWVAFFNVITGIILLNTGIQISQEDVKEVITLIFSKDYLNAGYVFLINILLPILKTIFKKK